MWADPRQKPAQEANVPSVSVIMTTSPLSAAVRLRMELGSPVQAVRSTRVLLGSELQPAVVLIKNGKIHQILTGFNFSADEVRGHISVPTPIAAERWLCYVLTTIAFK